MKIGYARVSTTDQSWNSQIDALKAEGCEKIYKDKISGVKTERPEFGEMLKALRSGDTVVVFKLDRLGRSLRHLIDTVAKFDEMGVSFKSINDPVDTTTPQGKLIFNIFGSLAEFERELIRERTKAGLASAKARGRTGGRPRGLSADAEKTAIVCESLYKDGNLSSNEIGRQLGISKATLYKYLRHRGVEISAYKK